MSAVVDPAGSAAPWPISIWQPSVDADGQVWRRPPPRLLGDHYAARTELRPKRALLPLRVVLFGESTAAGYLYAPHLTPAQVLESQLRNLGGQENFEVVDLARTNERLDTLHDTVASSLQINPDVLVIFAGNNWNLLETPEVSPYAESADARHRYARAAVDGGLDGPIAVAAAELRSRVETTFESIAQIARGVGIPVIVVVPEVNRLDWENRQPPTWLPGGANARWHQLYRQARRLLHARRWPEMAVLTQAMIRLDGGTCPTSHRLLARAEIALGNLDEALVHCRAEVDATPYATLCFLAAPQVTTGAQELIRAAARRPGWASVDLPRIFAEYTGAALQGRRLFLDYCHLTVEAVHVAMAAIAAEVMRFSGMFERDEDWRSLLARLPPIVLSPAVDATAKLGAAVHGAHRLLAVADKQAFVEYWCREALAASPAIADTLLDLAEARMAPVPEELTAAQQRVLAGAYCLQYQHGWHWDSLDAILMRAFETVLDEAAPALAVKLRHLLANALPSPRRRVNLAHARYLWEPLERFFPDAMASADRPERGTLRSPWPVSSFCLVADATTDLELDIIARLPILAGLPRRKGKAVVRVESVRVGSFELVDRWRRSTVRVRARHLRAGLNRLTIEWPLLPDEAVGENAIADAMARLEKGADADLHPVFGELFSITV